MNKFSIAILAASMGAIIGTTLHPGIQEIAIVAVAALLVGGVAPRMRARRPAVA